MTVAYEVDGIIELGLINAPKAGLIARYRRGAVADIDGVPARVKPTASLADAVISVCLTSHFEPDLVRRTVASVQRARDRRDDRQVKR